MYFRVIIVCLIIIAVLGSASSAYCYNKPSDEEALILGLINQIRQHPFEAAEALNIDEEKIRRLKPEIKELLNKGMGRLHFSPMLYTAAREHTLDMLENNYFSHTSLDGREVVDRIKGKGYTPLYADETILMMSFRNYIKPQKAIISFLKSMLEEELNASAQNELKIFNPDMQEAGVGFSGGSFRIEGQDINVYILTAVFGADKYSKLESYLQYILNSLRKRPLLILEQLDMDEESVREKLGELAWVMDKGLAPLAWNNILHYAASLNGINNNAEMDLEAVNYQAFDAEERSVSTFIESKEDHGEAAWLLAKELVLQELEDKADGKPPAIFNPAFTEVGINIRPGENNNSISGANQSLSVTAFFATPQEKRSYILGNAFKDIDEDKILDYGEGLMGLKVLHWAYGNANPFMVTTGQLGYYQLEIPTGIYEIQIRDKSDKTLKTVYASGLAGNFLHNFIIQ